jgi:ATP-dependent DNA helicase RecQ
MHLPQNQRQPKSPQSISHSDQSSSDRVLQKLRQIWGYSAFRPPQGEIVQALLCRQDALVVMPTGGGKSICFQLPALLETGLTLVVSPLVALMENQVQELQARRLPAALLHSELPAPERRKILGLLEAQKLRLLYLSPETLLSQSVWERLSHPDLVINGLILDEAHCLVQWGDSFRPAYRRLGVVRSALLKTKPAGSQIALAAFTATADPQAQQTIQQVLGLERPQRFVQTPYRANLHLAVQTVWTPRGRRHKLLKFIQSHSGTGLVYVRTRQDSETLAQWLTQQGYQTAAYHAGLSPSQRRQIEADWLQDRLPFVICTSAFGMGINKPEVRWVVHFHAPLLLSEYVQEVGRAGRDGKPALALTLVSEPTGWLDPDDQQRQQFFQRQQQRLQQQAQQLVRQLPQQGEVAAVTRQFKQAEIALALLHSSGQLEWLDPFHYRIQAARKTEPAPANRQMQRYLHSRACRWQMLQRAFGATEASTTEPGATKSPGPGCGHCDYCCRG